MKGICGVLLMIVGGGVRAGLFSSPNINWTMNHNWVKGVSSAGIYNVNTVEKVLLFALKVGKKWEFATF